MKVEIIGINNNYALNFSLRLKREIEKTCDEMNIVTGNQIFNLLLTRNDIFAFHPEGDFEDCILLMKDNLKKINLYVEEVKEIEPGDFRVTMRFGEVKGNE